MRIFTRRIWRIGRLVLHMLAGVFQTAVLFGFYTPAHRDRVISRWSAKLLRILHVRLISSPFPALEQGALLVANHVSWLDIFVILSARRVHFVSKQEVRKWPVIGWLAWRAGTLFIRRERKSDTARITKEMRRLLDDDAWVAMFPEGTSTDGSRLLRFLPSLFQPAVALGLPVVTAALRYRTPEGSFTAAAAYADELSFGRSLWNITAEREILVLLDVGKPIHSDDRRELATRCHAQIAQVLAGCPT